MTQEERDEIMSNVDVEGFDYAMVYTDSYRHIKDPKFQQLLASFLSARTKLQRYIESS